MVITTRAELARAFAVWERDYRDEPSLFMSGSEVNGQSAEDFGEVCADHLLRIIREGVKS